MKFFARMIAVVAVTVFSVSYIHAQSFSTSTLIGDPRTFKPLSTTTQPTVVTQAPVAPMHSVEMPLIGKVDCPFISSFMKLGNENLVKEVSKLQAFLRDTEGLDVAVTGDFDQKTQDAVVAFQEKYAGEILAPWSGKNGTGIVNLTTTKKINQIVCKTPLSLNGDEMKFIADYVARARSASSTDGIVEVAPLDAADLVAGAGLDTTKDQDVGNDDTVDPQYGYENTAAAGDTLASTFWIYFKGLFGR